ncbi:3'-5' exonuclease [Paracoccus sp. DMF-8]|uniref:3'-5' exonuclease n=1 Tax=Paracoccus sp. DMF-8 TaxID=3019445 RepID=UPI0023E88233|nr:ribonuclease H-like domain-containing protein [Paracoccus sp. DMF-8]MDF3606287.1 3'-5' exonuclease [Paracoccus sp. DMF-8]
MTDYIYLDIETLPAQSDKTIDYLTRSAKAPANIKDPSKIEAAKAEAATKAVASSSFDGWLGSICCIGFAVNDSDPITLTAVDWTEAEILRTFFKRFSNYDRPVIVGHHAAGFDVPFLTRRAIALGVALPPAVAWPRDPKPWSDKIADTMVMAAGSRDTISLDKLCFALGIPGKAGFDGSMVAEAWKRGDHHIVAEYCADDVRRVREIHKRFLNVGW